jgi:hypothetical protein
MDRDYLAEFETWLIGRSCSITRGEHDWFIELGEGATITVSVPWRIVSQGRIAFADRDHGQMFGLPAPVDGEAEAHGLLAGKRIASAKVDLQTADLTLHFDPDTRLDAFNNSAGYEGWQANCEFNGSWVWLIAQGGGNVAVFAGDSTS